MTRRKRIPSDLADIVTDAMKGDADKYHLGMAPKDNGKPWSREEKMLRGRKVVHQNNMPIASAAEEAQGVGQLQEVDSPYATLESLQDEIRSNPDFKHESTILTDNDPRVNEVILLDKGESMNKLGHVMPHFDYRMRKEIRGMDDEDDGGVVETILLRLEYPTEADEFRRQREALGMSSYEFVRYAIESIRDPHNTFLTVLATLHRVEVSAANTPLNTDLRELLTLIRDRITELLAHDDINLQNRLY